MKPMRGPTTGNSVQCDRPRCHREMALTVMGERLCEYHWQERCEREERKAAKREPTQDGVTTATPASLAAPKSTITTEDKRLWLFPPTAREVTT